jgi:hypothetical protein
VVSEVSQESLSPCGAGFVSAADDMSEVLFGCGTDWAQSSSSVELVRLGVSGKNLVT